MTFFIEDKRYDYSLEEMENRLISDRGTEGNVYRIDRKAVKIYKLVCFKIRLQEDSVNYLKTLKTNRIILPRERVFDENYEFNGYTTKLINPVNKENLKRLKMKQLLEEVKEYENDIKILTENNISIADLNIDNIVLSNEIYFCDPGSFEINSNRGRYVKILNEEEIRRFFINQIMARYSNLSKENQRKLDEYFSYDTYLSDMLEAESFDEKESVSHFVKKLIKKR